MLRNNILFIFIDFVIKVSFLLTIAFFIRNFRAFANFIILNSIFFKNNFKIFHYRRSIFDKRITLIFEIYDLKLLSFLRYLLDNYFNTLTFKIISFIKILIINAFRLKVYFLKFSTFTKIVLLSVIYAN